MVACRRERCSYHSSMYVISASSLQVGCDGRKTHRWKLGLNQFRLDHTHRTCGASHYPLSCLTASRPCYFPPWVSPPGRVGVLESRFALNFLPILGYSVCTEAAHYTSLFLRPTEYSRTDIPSSHHRGRHAASAHLKQHASICFSFIPPIF